MGILSAARTPALCSSVLLVFCAVCAGFVNLCWYSDVECQSAGVRGSCLSCIMTMCYDLGNQW